jgi:4-amino-4-deoxy-L-arabinose transferase-like glycosyltransferase
MTAYTPDITRDTRTGSPGGLSLVSTIAARAPVIVALIGILVLGAWLRLDRLTEVPPSLYCDEAAVGYDAWSIATYGKDQWGNVMPLAFQSFGEYKYPVHIYATAVSVKILGYSDLAVRLPSALVGILNLVLLFLLARKLLGSKWLALASVGLMSISPHHVQFSRIAWETNFALVLFLLALLAFVHGISGRSWLLAVAGLLFGLDLYTYNAAKAFVPLFVILAVALYWKSLWSRRRAAAAGATMFVLALLLSVARPELSGMTRFQQVQLPEAAVSESVLFRSTGMLPLGQLEVVARQYLLHLSPRYLFESGDPIRRHSIQQVGETYWFDLIFLPIGLLALLRRRQASSFLLLGWFFLAPLPGAIVELAPHAGRAMYTIGGWHMVSAVGLAAVWRFAQQGRSTLARDAIAASLAMVVTASILTYTHAYFNAYPTEYAWEWQYSLMRVFTDYRDEFREFDHVYVQGHHDQPYILALHYLRYDPEKFRSSVVLNEGERREISAVAQFDRFHFGGFDLGNPPAGRSLVFAPLSEGLENANRTGVVRDNDGSVALLVYEYSR